MNWEPLGLNLDGIDSAHDLTTNFVLVCGAFAAAGRSTCAICCGAAKAPKLMEAFKAFGRELTLFDSVDDAF